jgi:hypothetical protein
VACDGPKRHTPHYALRPRPSPSNTGPESRDLPDMAPARPSSWARKPIPEVTPAGGPPAGR